jgi:hypothetical protein
MGLFWDVAVFVTGFLVGVIAVLGVLFAARVRREALRQGDRLVERLGPIQSQRFIEAAQE